MYALAHAELINSWHENLPHEDVPPAWMWAVDDELELWFEEVKQRREARYGGNDDTEDARVGRKETPMMTNSLTLEDLMS